jgi:L-lactate dehydrogenase complex protein LldF
VAAIFQKELNVPYEIVPERLSQIARGVLRQKFLDAGIGISGANFLVADSGAVVIVENEGNARLATTAPKIHIAIAGIEKIIPRAQDLATFLKLLARSATGQALSVYTSFLSGPRRAGEIDGPDEFYVVLLDNGRTKLLPDRAKRQSLYCIRCAACLNTCPVYRKIGGHSFPWVYSGPIGAIITPQFMGVSHEPGLPFASSLCGACAEVCPVKIDIPQVLLDLRSEVKKSETREKKNRLEKLAYGIFAWVMTHPRIYAWAGSMARHAPVVKVGPVRAWTSQRDLPPMPRQSFREIWSRR